MFIIYKRNRILLLFSQVWFKWKVFCNGNKNSHSSLSGGSEGKQNWCLHLKFQGGNEIVGKWFETDAQVL